MRADVVRVLGASYQKRYDINSDDWSNVKRSINLKDRQYMVLTKKFNNSLSLMVFNENGMKTTNEFVFPTKLRKKGRQVNNWEKCKYIIYSKYVQNLKVYKQFHFV